MRQATLIFNPVAGRRRAPILAGRLVETLREAGFEATAAGTAGPGDATVLARQAADAGAEAVFGLGGDGTLREVARGLLGTSAALAILPAGSTNVLSRALGLPLDPLAAARRAGELVVRELDVGFCQQEPFLMMASCGLDASVLRRQGSSLKRWLGRTGVAFLGVAEWWRYGYGTVEITADGERSWSASFAAVCNIPLYGGPFRLAPQAEFDDAHLDLVLFRGRGRAATLAFARDLALGRHHRRPDVEMAKVQRVSLTLPAGGCLQVDGDALAPAPRDRVEIALSQQRLRVLAPPA